MVLSTSLPRCVYAYVQADSSAGVQPAASDHAIGVSSDEELRIPINSNEAVSTAADTDSRAVSAASRCSMLPADAELSDEKWTMTIRCAEDATCMPEVVREAPNGTGSRHRSHADIDSVGDSDTDNVGDSDIPAACTSTLDSVINPSHGDEESSDGDAVSDSEAGKVASADSAKVLMEEIATKDSTPPAESSGSEEPASNSDKDRPSRPDTMLSWSDSTQAATSSSTKCAVQFENSVIFDLDVE